MVFFRAFPGDVVCALAVLLFNCQVSASTGRSREITNIHFENVTQTTVDVVWNTSHPSTSQVLIARDTNYEPERWAPSAPDPALVTSHKVHVDGLIPYVAAYGVGQWYIYVASAQKDGTLSTSPGPQTGDGKNPLMSMRTLPTDFTGTPNMKISTFGPTAVFAGSDLYFQIIPILVSGPQAHLLVYNQTGYNNSSDGVVKYVASAIGPSIGGKGTPEKIAPHLSCAWANPPPSLDSAEQTLLDRTRNLGGCPNGNNFNAVSMRLRTALDTAPGKYAVTVTLEQNKQVVPFTYLFTVLPPAKAPLPVKLSPPPIPGLATWERQMVVLGNKWCAYRDQQNTAGNFVDNWGWSGDAWFYDGGRVFQNIDTYTATHGKADHQHWQHCALTLLDPYANYQVMTNGNMQGYSIFTVGMYQNFLRTGAPVMKDAIHLLATVGPQYRSCGSVDPYAIRENSYRINMWIEDALNGYPESPLLQRNIDKLLGNLQMAAVGQEGAVHPFMLGIGFETLIHWYALTKAQGHPDYRVLPVMKAALDQLWKVAWIDARTFDYDRYILPTNHGINYTALNNLVSHAYAWYWQQTGDADSLARGDLAFQHSFDSPGDYSWSGKQFSQMYEFSFDYVAYRQNKSATWEAANNPFTGAYADTEPPISEKVNCDPNYYRGCQAGSIGSSTARIFWGTYEPASTQVIYGTTTSYGSNSPLDPAMVTAHVVNLTGLTPGTTYHFRTRSIDAAGNIGSMHDLTFTTTRAQ